LNVHGGLEPSGGGGVFVTQKVSKSVDGKLGQTPKFVNQAIGLILPDGEEGLERLLLNGRKSVEKCRIGCAGQEMFPNSRLLPRAKCPEGILS